MAKKKKPKKKQKKASGEKPDDGIAPSSDDGWRLVERVVELLEKAVDPAAEVKRNVHLPRR